MPPSYGTKAYWDARFQHEDNYEWLLPADSLSAVIREVLSRRNSSSSRGSSSPSPPQILHIGCGSSDLSFRLRDLVDSPRQITNVDYSATAVQKCQLREAAALFATASTSSSSVASEEAAAAAAAHGPETSDGFAKEKTCSCSVVGMRWETADLLAAEAIVRLGRRDQSHSVVGGGGGGGYDDLPFFFDVVADKSTSDAISCSDDAPVLLPFVSPLMMQYLDNDDADVGGGAMTTTTTTALVHPVHLLALHMAVLARPHTGRWCALSYSDDRFSFLDGGSGSGSSSNHTEAEAPVNEDLLKRGFPDPRRFWRVERKERVTVSPPAATMGSGGQVVHTPEIAYWLYVLVRTDAVP